ncbi:MAG: Beta propeller domain, partial [Pseudomonadota bacterium]
MPETQAEPARDSASSAGNAAGPNISVSSDEDATSASSTNAQVAGIDEADFVKVVDNGKAMYLLHGSSLRKLKTYPPKDLAEQG